METTTFMQAIISGIVTGSIYLLVALGINIIFGAMRILNFAHCTYMMLAMYGGYYIYVFGGIDPYISLLILTPLFFLGGFATQKYFIEKVLATNILNQIILTVGLFITIKSLASLFFSETFRMIPVFYKTISYSLRGVYIGLPQLVAVIVSISLVLFLHLFLTRTDFGRMIRAASQDMYGASVCAINVYRVFCMAFGIGTALASVAGVLIATYYPIYPHVGDPFLLSGFIVVVLGGLGSFKGCVVSSYIIALTESLIAYAYIPAFQQVGSLVIFMIILLFKPKGIFGGYESK